MSHVTSFLGTTQTRNYIFTKDATLPQNVMFKTAAMDQQALFAPYHETINFTFIFRTRYR